jgi:hypothetical protein
VLDPTGLHSTIGMHSDNYNPQRSGGLVPGRSYSDPQEGLFGFLLLANREVIVKAAAAETPTITTVHSKRNFMISIFWFCLRFCSFYLESQSQRILDRDPPSLVLSAF